VNACEGIGAAEAVIVKTYGEDDSKRNGDSQIGEEVAAVRRLVGSREFHGMVRE
jgi:hypothetical protein